MNGSSTENKVTNNSSLVKTQSMNEQDIISTNCMV